MVECYLAKVETAVRFRSPAPFFPVSGTKDAVLSDAQFTLSNAQIVTSPEVLQQMQQIGAMKLNYWKPIYGANLTDALIFPSAYVSDRLLWKARSRRS